MSTSLDVVTSPPPGDAGLRRRRWFRLAATFLVLFGLGLAIALPDVGATQVDALNVRANEREPVVVEKLGNADPAHYVGVGYDIARLHRLPGRATRILNWWPPGMHLYYAALFTVFGDDMPVGVVAGVTMAALWALLLTAFVDLLGRFLRWGVVAAMVGIILLSDVMQDWILGRGLLWSEGLFTWFLFAALYAAMRSTLATTYRKRLVWAAVVGALLGISAYVRTVSELLGWLMLGLLAVWAVLTVARFLIRRWRSSSDDTRAGHTWHRELLALALCAAAFQLVTVPWRIYAAQNLRPGNYTWSEAPNGVWHDSWTPDHVMVERQQYYLYPGRPNTACHVDPVECRKIAAHELRQVAPYSGLGRYHERDYRRLAIQAFVDYPTQYTLDRVTHLRKAWFWQPVGHTSEILQNGLFAISVVAGLWLSLRRVRRSGPDLVALLYPGLVLATMAPFAFLHYEARYFVTVKLLSVALLFVLIALDRELAQRLRLTRPDPVRAASSGTTPPEPTASGI